MYYNLNDNGGFLSPRSITESYNMTVAKENDELKKQLEAYENMRKEAIEYIKWQRENPQYDNVWRNSECESLLNILNKVGVVMNK